VVDTENYLMICPRDIELKPVKAGIVEPTADDARPSYRANDQGQ
jgi:hypothetical protein